MNTGILLRIHMLSEIAIMTMNLTMPMRFAGLTLTRFRPDPAADGRRSPGSRKKPKTVRSQEFPEPIRRSGFSKAFPHPAPPVGNLRWRPPQPAARWDGVRRADRFGPACMQAPQVKGSFYQLEFYPMDEPISEDCLCLNIWTAAQSTGEKRPVLVWIHGGALREGSGSLPSFDGEALARKGAVLVTLNYRMGVFEFFAHPDSYPGVRHNASGNYGMMDQVAALRWVQKNIAAFAGIPTM